MIFGDSVPETNMTDHIKGAAEICFALVSGQTHFYQTVTRTNNEVRPKTCHEHSGLLFGHKQNIHGEHFVLRMSPWWCLCILYQLHAR